MNRIAYGLYGEELAVKYLKKHKYKILERNYRCILGEVDIIAKKGAYLVFVEVKARTDDRYGLPMEAVDERKQYKLIALSQYYQKIKRKLDMPIRFDVVQVLGDEITLIENAFEPF